MGEQKVDILEDDILTLSPELLSELLKDRSTGKNIFWATDNYEQLGKGYQYKDEILIENITGKHTRILRPRAVKSKAEQQIRIKQKAEVFTPSWLCNAQNNLIDEAWFGSPCVFNKEITDADGAHSWETSDGKILFPDGRAWQEYVCDTRLEVACGEAPYIVSRYDTTTGDYIDIKDRVGLLDRKLRVVGENTDSKEDWNTYSFKALKSVYGFDWQGDNLLIARESVLYTWKDYYIAKFGEEPSIENQLKAAFVISWNIWQMDGLKMVVPDSCKEQIVTSKVAFFDEPEEQIVMPCRGCKENNIHYHNGIYCIVAEWDEEGDGYKQVVFKDLFPRPVVPRKR